jgi:hypothetical protein
VQEEAQQMKPLAECLELIHGKKLEEFIQEHPFPVLIGLGVIASELQRNPTKAAGTMFVNLSAMPDQDDDSTNLNQVFNIEKVSAQTPPDGIYLGSGLENDICIPDSSISKTHTHFILSGSECSLIDHGSTNGSFVNGAKVPPNEPLVIKGGDVLTLGRISFTYYDATSFAKLLAVQAMARSRTRRPPRTPGSVRTTPTSRKAPTIGSRSHPDALPWAQQTPGENIRRTGVIQTPREPTTWKPGGPPSGEWRQRAVGRIPRGQPGAQDQPQSALRTGRRTAADETGVPSSPNLPVVKKKKSWFARMLLRLSRWLQRLAGDE